MKNDLISREALKRKLQYVYSCDYIDSKSKEGIASDIIDEIDNAPTEGAIYIEMYNKGYMSGYENCKKDVIHSIVKQYNEHNELVPSWLHIGNMREEDDD